MKIQHYSPFEGIEKKPPQLLYIEDVLNYWRYQINLDKFISNGK